MIKLGIKNNSNIKLIGKTTLPFDIDEKEKKKNISKKQIQKIFPSLEQNAQKKYVLKSIRHRYDKYVEATKNSESPYSNDLVKKFISIMEKRHNVGVNIKENLLDNSNPTALKAWKRNLYDLMIDLEKKIPKCVDLNKYENFQQIGVYRKVDNNYYEYRLLGYYDDLIKGFKQASIQIYNRGDQIAVLNFTVSSQISLYVDDFNVRSQLDYQITNMLLSAVLAEDWETVREFFGDK